ncbi:hypothetical protein LWC34_16840 [Kibdelosporangium philippinense]|uniref:Uncharacterized protein n=1 Tax=Kibdelosporangium philippinense TaxID=211113 RepID=A0ABS8Z9D7_9PSEU|nr:hypothetical protein [Kibdelosporangium philippinense]MCE7004489.1 hypothetical protein [Kibdelosporangium philippinense]
MTETDNVHRLTTVTLGDHRAEVDEQLAPLIAALWSNGFETVSCCQDLGESLAAMVESKPHMASYVQAHRGWALVDFPIGDGLAFLTAIARAGPRDDFYERMTYWAFPDAWDINIKPMDEALFDYRLPSRFGLHLLQVSFPLQDLDEIQERLECYDAGDLVVSGPP